jgi:UDP-N-acetylglucosamine--N-acetylmuramyl-(pentapeptide) pyrophosphoryl-undecaprenol N-acetylglucosamine transferase
VTDDRRLLAVAATGGHLDQLHGLVPRLEPAPSEVEWVTFDTPQSRALLSGEHVHWVPFVDTREVGPLARSLPGAAGLLRRGRFSAVVSTGSGIALAYLPWARAFGAQAHYIESATRTEGPSLTGRMLARLPWLRVYTQSPRWQSDRWRYRGSVLDEFVPDEPVADVPEPRRVVVVLGTNPYGFRALVERLLAILPAGADVLWQTGVTDVSGLGIDARAEVPGDELAAAIAAADVTVAHAGTGSALQVLKAGRTPLLVPRRPDHGEQVDDHQREVAAELEGRGVAVVASADAVTGEDLLRAARGRVRRVAPGPFELG